MRLNKQTQVAIGILTACAERPDERLRTETIATITQTSRDHAAHIVLLLARNHYIATTRGRLGGVSLATEADQIILGDIIRLTEGRLKTMNGAPQNEIGIGKENFGIIMRSAMGAFLSLMDRFTISDLVSQQSNERLACLECALLNPARRVMIPYEPQPTTMFQSRQARQVGLEIPN